MNMQDALDGKELPFAKPRVRTQYQQKWLVATEGNSCALAVSVYPECLGPSIHVQEMYKETYLALPLVAGKSRPCFS